MFSYQYCLHPRQTSVAFSSDHEALQSQVWVPFPFMSYLPPPDLWIRSLLGHVHICTLSIAKKCIFGDPHSFFPVQNLLPTGQLRYSLALSILFQQGVLFVHISQAAMGHKETYPNTYKHYHSNAAFMNDFVLVLPQIHVLLCIVSFSGLNTVTEA